MPNAALAELIEEGSKVLPLPPDERRQLQGMLSADDTLKSVVGLLLAAGLIYFLEQRGSLAPEERERFHDLLNRAALDSGLVTKADLVKEVRGKYAHLGLSSEAFAAQKQEEIRLEDRR